MESRSEMAAAGMNSDGSVAPADAAGTQKKDRHIVSWTPKVSPSSIFPVFVFCLQGWRVF